MKTNAVIYAVYFRTSWSSSFPDPGKMFTRQKVLCRLAHLSVSFHKQGADKCRKSLKYQFQSVHQQLSDLQVRSCNFTKLTSLFRTRTLIKSKANIWSLTFSLHWRQSRPSHFTLFILSLCGMHLRTWWPLSRPPSFLHIKKTKQPKTILSCCQGNIWTNKKFYLRPTPLSFPLEKKV